MWHCTNREAGERMDGGRDCDHKKKNDRATSRRRIAGRYILPKVYPPLQAGRQLSQSSSDPGSIPLHVFPLTARFSIPQVRQHSPAFQTCWLVH